MIEQSTALLALESTTRSKVKASTSTLAAETSAALGVALTEQQDGSGTEFLSRSDVDAAITAALAASQERDQAIANAAYTAAALLALAALTIQFKELGHEVSQQLAVTTANIGELLAAISTAHGEAKLDLHDLIRDGYDGVTGVPDAVTAARHLVLRGAIQQTATRVGNRAALSAVLAVHQGYTDAELATFRDFEALNPYVAIRKQWLVQSTNPCHHCSALDGTVLPVATAFDPAATTDTHATQVPWLTSMLGPPRHPNCRCRLALVVVDQGVTRTD